MSWMHSHESKGQGTQWTQRGSQETGGKSINTHGVDGTAGKRCFARSKHKADDVVSQKMITRRSCSQRWERNPRGTRIWPENVGVRTWTTLASAEHTTTTQQQTNYRAHRDDNIDALSDTGVTRVYVVVSIRMHKNGQRNEEYRSRNAGLRVKTRGKHDSQKCHWQRASQLFTWWDRPQKTYSRKTCKLDHFELPLLLHLIT